MKSKNTPYYSPLLLSFFLVFSLSDSWLLSEFEFESLLSTLEFSVSSSLGLSFSWGGVYSSSTVSVFLALPELTVIVNGNGEKSELDNRISHIKNQIEESDSEFDTEKLQERLAKLSGGVAVIQVGAATEVELKERKLRIEDALAATRAAVEEGIVAGGGTVLIDSIDAVSKVVDELEDDEKTGANIILKALEEPLRQIAENAGLEGSVVVEQVKTKENGIGFDAYKKEYVDMKKEGIVDPTKVTRSALQNAASVASMILTTEAAVANIKEDEPEMPAMNPGMGMM